METVELKARENQIIDLIKDFCTQKLNDDCFNLCKDVVKQLSELEKQPLALGQTNIWAAAVINALGTANAWFIKYKELDVHTTVKEVNAFFGTKSVTVGNRAKEIREWLDLGGPQTSSIKSIFGTFREIADTVMRVQFDGKLVPIRTLPPDLRDIAINASTRGLKVAFTTSANGKKINVHILS